MGDTTPEKTVTSSSSTKNPWAPAVAGLEDVLGKTQQYGNDASIWSPTYSGATTGALGSINNFANGPNYGQQALQTSQAGGQASYGMGLGALANTAGGGMLNGNPYLDAVNQYTVQNTGDAVNRAFSGMGRYGSAAHTGELTRNLGGIINNNMMNNYNTERGYQNSAANSLYQGGMGALGNVGAMQQAALQPYNAQLAAGQTQDQMDQARRMAGVNATNWQAGLTGSIAGLGGDTSGTSSSAKTPSVNQLGQGLGFAQMGLGLLGI